METLWHNMQSCRVVLGCGMDECISKAILTVLVSRTADLKAAEQYLQRLGEAFFVLCNKNRNLKQNASCSELHVQDQ